MTIRRKAALGAALPLILVFVTLLASGACSKMQFERDHDAAVKDNPWGVELRMEADPEARTFHAGERLHFRERYTSKSRRMWQLEVLDGSNPADAANVALLSDGTVTLRQPYASEAKSCCKWRYVMLDDEAVVLPYRFNPEGGNGDREILLPQKPGRYQIYIETHRLVMRKGEGLDPATHTGYPLTSNNLLTVEVVP